MFLSMQRTYFVNCSGSHSSPLQRCTLLQKLQLYWRKLVRLPLLLLQEQKQASNPSPGNPPALLFQSEWVKFGKEMRSWHPGLLMEGAGQLHTVLLCFWEHEMGTDENRSAWMWNAFQGCTLLMPVEAAPEMLQNCRNRGIGYVPHVLEAQVSQRYCCTAPQGVQVLICCWSSRSGWSPSVLCARCLGHL